MFFLCLQSGRIGDFSVDDGVVAELVERLLCMQEVVGSSPIDSTSFF